MMIASIKKIIGVSLLIVIVSTWSSLLLAQEVRILIDVSGSMKETDPRKLRTPVVQLIIDQIQNKNYAGIWSFAENIHTMVPNSLVDSRWRAQALAQAKKINSKGEYSSLRKAIKTVTIDWMRNKDQRLNPALGKDLNRESREYKQLIAYEKTRPIGFVEDTSFNTKKKNQKVLIIITDGRIDISDNEKINEIERNEIINNLIPKLKKNNINVYTIGLSNNINQYLLRLLAENTDGKYQLIQHAYQVKTIFHNVLTSAKNPSTDFLKNNTFTVRRGTKEITLFISHKNKTNFSIIQPSGTPLKLTKKNAYSKTTFTLVTVKQPAHGKWAIAGLTGKFSRTVVFNDLHLEDRKLSQHLFAGQKTFIYGYLNNRNKRITEKKITDTTDMNLFIDNEKPIPLNKPTNLEINYRKDFFIPTHLKGEVPFVVKAKGKTFSLQSKQMVVLEPFPYTIKLKKKTKENMLLHIITKSSSIVHSNVRGEVVFPTYTETLKISKTLSQNYISRFLIQCYGKTFDVKLYISGRKLNGENFELKPIVFTKKCKKKIVLVSDIEVFDPLDLNPKVTLAQIKAKKKKEPKIRKMILIGLAIAGSLTVLSILLSLFSKMRKRKMLKKVLSELTDEEAQESDEPKQVDKKEKG